MIFLKVLYLKNVVLRIYSKSFKLTRQRSHGTFALPIIEKCCCTNVDMWEGRNMSFSIRY